jgi:hypothetical protein
MFQIGRDCRELRKSGLEVFDDFGGDDVGVFAISACRVSDSAI